MSLLSTPKLGDARTIQIASIAKKAVEDPIEHKNNFFDVYSLNKELIKRNVEHPDSLIETRSPKITETSGSVRSSYLDPHLLGAPTNQCTGTLSERVFQNKSKRTRGAKDAIRTTLVSRENPVDRRIQSPSITEQSDYRTQGDPIPPVFEKFCTERELPTLADFQARRENVHNVSKPAAKKSFAISTASELTPS